jgi:hypothetical protein
MVTNMAGVPPLQRLHHVITALNSGAPLTNYASAHDVDAKILEEWVEHYKPGLNGPCGNMVPSLLPYHEADIVERLRRRREPLGDGKSTWVRVDVCLEAAARITTLEVALAAATTALEPFSKAAGAVFTRNWSAPDVVFELRKEGEHAAAKITAGDLFAARVAITTVAGT